jgi:hypothetical protein
MQHVVMPSPVPAPRAALQFRKENGILKAAEVETWRLERSGVVHHQNTLAFRF